MIDINNLSVTERREILNEFYSTETGQLFIDFTESMNDIVRFHEDNGTYDAISADIQKYKKLVKLAKIAKDTETQFLNRLITVQLILKN